MLADEVMNLSIRLPSRPSTSPPPPSLHFPFPHHPASPEPHPTLLVPPVLQPLSQPCCAGVVDEEPHLARRCAHTWSAFWGTPPRLDLSQTGPCPAVAQPYLPHRGLPSLSVTAFLCALAPAPPTFTPIHTLKGNCELCSTVSTLARPPVGCSCIRLLLRYGKHATWLQLLEVEGAEDEAGGEGVRRGAGEGRAYSAQPDVGAGQIIDYSDQISGLPHPPTHWSWPLMRRNEHVSAGVDSQLRYHTSEWAAGRRMCLAHRHILLGAQLGECGDSEWAGWAGGYHGFSGAAGAAVRPDEKARAMSRWEMFEAFLPVEAVKLTIALTAITGNSKVQDLMYAVLVEARELFLTVQGRMGGGSRRKKSREERMEEAAGAAEGGEMGGGDTAKQRKRGGGSEEKGGGGGADDGLAETTEDVLGATNQRWAECPTPPSLIPSGLLRSEDSLPGGNQLSHKHSLPLPSSKRPSHQHIAPLFLLSPPPSSAPAFLPPRRLVPPPLRMSVVTAFRFAMPSAALFHFLLLNQQNVPTSFAFFPTCHHSLPLPTPTRAFPWTTHFCGTKPGSMAEPRAAATALMAVKSASGEWGSGDRREAWTRGVRQQPQSDSFEAPQKSASGEWGSGDRREAWTRGERQQPQSDSFEAPQKSASGEWGSGDRREAWTRGERQQPQSDSFEAPQKSASGEWGLGDRREAWTRGVRQQPQSDSFEAPQNSASGEWGSGDRREAWTRGERQQPQCDSDSPLSCRAFILRALNERIIHHSLARA
ncbi:unnamed protein product [Closterium sp. Naga37s-1]|nr:unnamed protein product [Closterium sp. Naga37s-1]